VSNSLAVEANSSSSSGRSLALTERTVTVTSADSPALGPDSSAVEKVFDSSADSPRTASSRPSMSWPEPTS
jgi:hypothetical protein